MLSFEHAEYLLGLTVLLLLALLFFSTLVWKKKVKKSLGDEELISQLILNYSRRKYILKFILLLSAVAFMVLSAANLRKPVPNEKEKKAGIDIMIALDVSKSMWSEDVKPSRLDKAKQFINLLIERIDDNRIGLVVFAGRAYLQMPLTSDITAAKIFVANASPDAAPVQGTVIGDALQLCANSLNTQEKKYKAVVLISDGEDHDPKSENVLQHLYDNGVIVHTVGIGTAEGAPIIEPGTNVYKTDINGQTVISKLNEKELQTIAEKTGGTYHNLTEAKATANEIMQMMNSMEKKQLEMAGNTKRYASFYPFFLALAVILLIVEIFIAEIKKKRI
ncbi:MAG: VWA domain-containing protein [Parafilimonas sp.]